MRLRDTLMVHNERVKLFAGFLNAIALGLIGFAILRPLTSGTFQFQWLPIQWLPMGWACAGLALHALSHYILGMLRKEQTP